MLIPDDDGDSVLDVRRCLSRWMRPSQSIPMAMVSAITLTTDDDNDGTPDTIR